MRLIPTIFSLQLALQGTCNGLLNVIDIKTTLIPTTSTKLKSSRTSDYLSRLSYPSPLPSPLLSRTADYLSGLSFTPPLPLEELSSLDGSPPFDNDSITEETPEVTISDTFLSNLQINKLDPVDELMADVWRGILDAHLSAKVPKVATTSAFGVPVAPYITATTSAKNEDAPQTGSGMTNYLDNLSAPSISDAGDLKSPENPIVVSIFEDTSGEEESTDMSPEEQESIESLAKYDDASKEQMMNDLYGHSSELRDTIYKLQEQEDLFEKRLHAVEDFAFSTVSPIVCFQREIRMSAFGKVYKRLKNKGISATALLAKAVGMAVQSHPTINYAYEPSGGANFKPDINIALAVAIGGRLVTPTIQNANRKGALDLAQEWRNIIEKAKTGTLTPDDYQSGTMTLTNLGLLEASQSEPVLQVPSGQGCILIIGATDEKFTSGSVSVSGYSLVKSMTVTLACDRRCVQRSDANHFLQTLSDIVENQAEKLVK